MDTGYPALIIEPASPEEQKKEKVHIENPQDENSSDQDSEPIHKSQFLGFLSAISVSDSLSW